jgi:sugar phosphate isomerase/epimerase
MRLSISNIAWLPDEEKAIAALLRDEGVRDVEVAPTRIADDPRSLSRTALRDYRAFWNDHGISIRAMQSLLFNRPELHIFRSDASMQATVDYLSVIIDIGVQLGATVLVFGSPKQRTIAGINASDVSARETEFFWQIGKAAASAGVHFCVEPNPPAYGCDYVNTIDEAVALFERLGPNGLGLHADAAAMTMVADPPEKLITLAPMLKHFHISEPDLALIGSGGVPHERFAAALGEGGYRWLVSIEMRAAALGENAARVRAALATARAAYGGGGAAPRARTPPDFPAADKR